MYQPLKYTPGSPVEKLLVLELMQVFHQVMVRKRQTPMIALLCILRKLWPGSDQNLDNLLEAETV